MEDQIESLKIEIQELKDQIKVIEESRDELYEENKTLKAAMSDIEYLTRDWA